MASSTRPHINYSYAMTSLVILNVLFFGIIGLLLIGPWQVLDALIRTLLGDRRRINYLLAVVIFFLVLLLLTRLGTGKGITYYVSFVANIYALAYCYITYQHANSEDEAPEKPALPDDILDADL